MSTHNIRGDNRQFNPIRKSQWSKPKPPKTPSPPRNLFRFVSFSGMNLRALNQDFLINQELYHPCNIGFYEELTKTRIVFLQKKTTDVSPLFVVRNIKMSLSEISN